LIRRTCIGRKIEVPKISHLCVDKDGKQFALCCFAFDGLPNVILPMTVCYCVSSPKSVHLLCQSVLRRVRKGETWPAGLRGGGNIPRRVGKGETCIG